MKNVRSDLPTFWRVFASRSSAQSMEAFYTVYKTLLAAKARRADFLENVVNINNFSESYTHEIIPYTIYNFTDTRVTALTTAQQDSLKTAYNHYTSSFVMYITDLLQVASITDSLYNPSIVMSLNMDYARQNYGEFKFFTDIFSVDGKLPVTEETIYVPLDNTPVTCTKTVLYFIDAEVKENWFYKRLGYILGLPEDTDPDIVIALYKIRIEGLGYKTLDAFFQACNGIPISRKDEYVLSISNNVVTTTSMTYTLPVGQEIIVRAGQRITIGDPFIHAIYMVDSNIFPEWWLYDPFQMAVIPTQLYGYSDSSTYALPVKIEELTSPFWFGFPNLPLYLMEYFVGGDPITSTGVVPGVLLDDLTIFPNYIKYYPVLGIDIRIMIDGADTGSISSFADSSVDAGIKTKVTSIGHGMVNDDVIVITGTGGLYDGTFTLSNVTVTTFDILTVFTTSTTGDWEKANTFTWSFDDGVTWEASGVSMTGEEQILRDGVSVRFASIVGHAIPDLWKLHVDANWGAATFPLYAQFQSSFGGYNNVIYYASGKFVTQGVKRGDFVYMLYDNLGVGTIYRSRVLEVIDETKLTMEAVVDPNTPENGPEQFLPWPPGTPDVYLKIFRTYDGNMYDSIYQVRFTPIDHIMQVLDKHYARVFIDTSIINEVDTNTNWLPVLTPTIPLWTYLEYNYVEDITPYKEALRNEGII